MNSSCFDNSKGRPTKNRITYEKCDLIVEYLIRGKKINEISKLEGMPPVMILYSWCTRNLYLKNVIARVKEFKEEYRNEILIEKALRNLKFK